MKQSLIIAAATLLVGITGCGKDVTGTYEYGLPGMGMTITLKKNKTVDLYDPAVGVAPEWSKYTVSGDKIIFSINPDGLIFTLNENGELVEKGGLVYQRIK